MASLGIRVNLVSPSFIEPCFEEIRMRAFLGVTAATLTASGLSAQVPRAISADPQRDSANPARMEVLHIPSGGVNIMRRTSIWPRRSGAPGRTPSR